MVFVVMMTMQPLTAGLRHAIAKSWFGGLLSKVSKLLMATLEYLRICFGHVPRFDK